MIFPTKLLSGTLIKRYKRFLADIKLEESGEIITAHCPNSGSMLGVKRPGIKVWVSKVNSKNAKLKYKWELAVDEMGQLTGINTHRANEIVYEALQGDRIVELSKNFSHIRREVKYGEENSRIDFLLSKTDEINKLNHNSADSICYLEVKNVHLSRSLGLAEFPDARTSRGAKHMRELAKIAQQDGCSAYVLFLVQRMDVQKFSIAKDIDPEYYDAFKQAIEAGVKVLVYDCEINLSCIKLGNTIELSL